MGEFTRLRCAKCGSIRPVWLGNYRLGSSPLIDVILAEHFKKTSCGRSVGGSGMCEGELILEGGELTPQEEWTAAEKKAYGFWLHAKDRGDKKAYG